MISASLSVAVLHPGEMGAAVGAALRSSGHRVLWVAASRSEASRTRATDAGLEECADLPDVLHADAIVSVVPPDRAVEVAASVRDAGFDGLFVDANAVAPSTAVEIAGGFGGGAGFVDGGIVGIPPWVAGTTRIALSGERADDVASLFEGSHLEPVVVGSAPGAASAFKVGFAAWTKGTSALALMLDSFLDAHGLGDQMRHEWSRRGMDVEQRIDGAAAGAVPKAWRFDGEMREIAVALSEVGLAQGWFDAAATSYERLAEFKDRFADPPPLEVVRRRLRGDGS
jgi:3-hydroxyisobutyrate dehydrogenase-like beta-hydroxyacid dehydrogenase